MVIVLLLISIPFVMLIGTTSWYGILVLRRRLRHGRRPEQPRYRVEPFFSAAHVYSLAQFKELQKRYSMDSDNGTSLWACEKGHWVETSTGKPVKAKSSAIRNGATFDPIFTHIEFLPK